MNATNEQIVALYENMNLSVEQIYEALDGAFKPASIRMALASGSKVYRERMKQEGAPESLFTKDDAQLGRAIIRELAMEAENEGVRAKMACRLLDEALGRNDMKAIRNVGDNINIVNVQINQAQEAIKASKEQTIIINPEHKHLAEIAA